MGEQTLETGHGVIHRTGQQIELTGPYLDFLIVLRTGLWSSQWPQTHYVTEDELELLVFCLHFEIARFTFLCHHPGFRSLQTIIQLARHGPGDHKE